MAIVYDAACKDKWIITWLATYNNYNLFNSHIGSILHEYGKIYISGELGLRATQVTNMQLYWTALDKI